MYHFSKVVNFYSGYEAWIKDLIATRFLFLALSLMISLCKSLSFPLCLSCVSHLPLKERDTDLPMPLKLQILGPSMCADGIEQQSTVNRKLVPATSSICCLIEFPAIWVGM